ncbi:MAG: hypothetical protein IJA49_06165 [Oscillospiraceae bacterium]|nr:hypothetical protein [Oscillospiraceae bacterium]
MKRILSILLCMVLAVSLAGCVGSAKLPAQMADGSSWDHEWVGLGGRIGVEEPEQGFRLLTTNGTQKNADLYYATWIAGNEHELGDGAYAYDCQLYLMAENCTISTDAEETLELWREQIGEGFSVTAETAVTAAGVEYTLISYDCLAEDSHFASGVTALGIQGATAIVADLGLVEGYDLDPVVFMTEFLEGFHYA